MHKIKNFYQHNRTFLIIFIVVLVYYVQHLISFRLGMYCEEGRDANACLWALQGYLPYRDFEWTYGPFSFLIYPFIMKVFGINLIVLRISYIIFASLVIPLTYFLARRLMPHFWAGIAAFLSIIFFGAPDYTYNHVFAVLGELGCLLMVCRFIGPDKRISNLFWAGIFAAITVLTKPLSWGISLFVSISLFLLLFNELGPLRKRRKDYSIFVIATFSLILVYSLYFYSQTTLKNITITYPYFARDSALFIDSINRITMGVVVLFLKRLIFISPIIRQIIYPTSFTDIKAPFLASSYNFTLDLPFIVSILIFLLYIASKFNKVSPEIKEKIYRDKKFLFLFIIFSILISLEPLIIPHGGSRIFTIQVPFILSVYILYLIKKVYSHRSVITTAFIVLFPFCFTFSNFFYYPYSVIKRYTKPLNFDRAKGVLVTEEEKELYESLSSYLALNLDKDDKMAVMDYLPQISFLTKQENIFEKDECIFLKLGFVLEILNKKEKMKMLLALFEDKVISKMERERPKVVLGITGESSRDLEFYTSKIKDYIKKNYSLDKVIGSPNIRGSICAPCQLRLYKYKGD